MKKDTEELKKARYDIIKARAIIERMKIDSEHTESETLKALSPFIDIIYDLTGMAVKKLTNHITEEEGEREA
ncbi:hypothetical protein ANASTE_01578 [Anaerofustis stercorihominis DSM 17244]|uniref:Uncharacterized protein n=1 Tax=Anaerofustis stercorihominis DSM 17244 TaxID=445971 RepID=B1CC78_9FIRM|nr:hypothetical protein [Anaerofustis stercorihominis]EDS71875.1 hypothetical protein ANASTE_01578 [Anaerofustis stercorihominis DSM 17244]